MNQTESLEKLKQLGVESETIRRQLGISSPNSVIFCAPINPFENEDVVVEADGLGGARLSVVEGNFPIDFLCLRERAFESERSAIEEAQRLSNAN
jgi:hypothetical protein